MAVRGVKPYWLSGKEKVSCGRVSKEGHGDNLLEHEMTHLRRFLERG